MANYAASVLAEAKLILKDRFAEPEKRLKTAGVIGSFFKNTDIAIPNAGVLRTATTRAEKAYFMNRTKRANGGARTHDHTGVRGDSTEVALSWSTFSDKCSTSLKRSRNNIFEDATILANELEQMFKNVYEAQDDAALAYLATNKTAVNAATKNGVFDTTNNAFEIATADISRFLQYGKSMLRQNYHRGSADVILDAKLYAEAMHILQQGSGNSTNTAYQREMLDFFEAVTLNDANYAEGAGYFVPTGTIAAIDWIDPLNAAGKGDYESFVGGYGSIVSPIDGKTYMLHGYSQRADTSAIGGEVQDVTTEWELSIDLSFNKAPLTTANETTIFEVGVTDAPANA